MISSDQVEATLAFLIPGFVALKIFYLVGQRTKRADWEWTLWSLLVSAPIGAAANVIAAALGQPTGSLTDAIATCGASQVAGKTGADVKAAIATCASDNLASHNAGLRLLVSLVIAVAAAVVLAAAWRIVAGRFPRLRERASLQAWDAVLSQPHWVQLQVGTTVYSGRVSVAADPVETDALDLYLEEPAIVRGAIVEELNQTEGLWVPREKIEWIEVLKPSPAGGEATEA
jgi:hypothetical protein